MIGSEPVAQAPGVQPRALEVSLRVARRYCGRARTPGEATWHKQLELAQYEVDRALRQYNIVEPENRAVARTPEQQPVGGSSEHRALKQEHAHALDQQPSCADRGGAGSHTDARCGHSVALGYGPDNHQRRQTADHPADGRKLHRDDGTDIPGGKWTLRCSGPGGHKTETSVTRPVARLQQLSYYPAPLVRVKGLRQQGLTAQQIAQQLNDEGWRPAKRRTTWNPNTVLQLCASLRGPRTSPSPTTPRRKSPRQPGPCHSSHDTPICQAVTLYAWLRRGWIHARQQNDPRCTWMVDADPG